MRRVWLLTVAALVLVCSGLFATGQTEAVSEDKVIVLKLGHEAPIEDMRHQAAVVFKEVVEEETGGRAEVKIYPAASLGTKEELQVGMQTGTADILIDSFATLQRFSDFAALDFMPFLYRDKDHFFEVWESGFKDDFYGELESQSGFKVMGVLFRGGRELNSREPITSLQELEGIKIRVPTSDIMIQTWRNLGASPTPMSFSEVFGALQQGVIDAQENPFQTIVANSLHEVAPNITVTDHVMGMFNFIFWGETYASYPDWLKDAIVKGVDAASDEYNSKITANEQSIIDKYESMPSVNLHRLSDPERQRWQERVQPILFSIPSLVPYVEQVLATP